MSTRYLLFFRTILFGTLLSGALNAPGAPDALRWIAVWLPLYMACALALWAVERFRGVPPALVPWTFLLDIGVAVSTAYALPGNSSDFFIAFFLIILSSTLLRKPAFSVLVAAAACLAYGTLAPPEPGLWMRLALLAVIAFFSAFMTNYVRHIERLTAQPYERKISWLERLSLVGQALTSVLHEVKTPLGTVILSVENIRKRLKRGEDVEEELTLITQEAERASEILVNFLEFTRPAEIALSPLRLRDPLDKALAAARLRLQERGIALERGAGDEARVLGSERHLIQVFTNLLSNAAHAMPDGGTLTVSQTRRDGRAVVRLQDTGLGIPRDQLARLFEPGRGEGAPGEGYGLGLGIARWIVQKHGGELLIDSAGPGLGASSSVELPLSEKS